MRIVNIFFIILFILSCKYDNDPKNTFEKVKASESIYRGLNNFILDKEIIQYKIEDQTISERILFQKIDGDYKYLKDLIKNGPILVFTFDQFRSCDLCIEEAVKDIQKSLDLNSKIRIIIVSNFDSRRANIVFKNKINEPRIEVLSSEYVGFFNKTINNYPSFFVVDQTETIKMFYIHDQSINELTNSYLAIVSERFFKE